MKKNFLFGILFIAILTINFISFSETYVNDQSLASIVQNAKADEENGTKDTKCAGSECDAANGYFYKTETLSDGSRICCGIRTETDRGCKESM